MTIKLAPRRYRLDIKRGFHSMGSMIGPNEPVLLTDEEATLVPQCEALLEKMLGFRFHLQEMQEPGRDPQEGGGDRG